VYKHFLQFIGHVKKQVSFDILIKYVHSLYHNRYYNDAETLIDRCRIQRKTWVIRPYAGVDYNLTFCPFQSRLQHIYHEH
jgi:hypothetical protein